MSLEAALAQLKQLATPPARRTNTPLTLKARRKAERQARKRQRNR